MYLDAVSSGFAVARWIRLDAPGGFHFDDLRVGEHGCCQDGILSFQNTPLRVALHKARRWRSDLEGYNTDMTDPGTALAWTCAWKALTDRQEKASAEIVAGDLFCSEGIAKRGVACKVSRAVRALVQATRRNAPGAVTAAGALIGLGSGLTPSGDDLLVGYLTGLWCTVRAKTDRRKFISEFGRAIIDLSQGTNDISRTYLLHAARGQVSSRLAGLARAISEGMQTDLLQTRMENAASMGHTSGMDTLTGLLIGLATWDYPGIASFQMG